MGDSHLYQVFVLTLLVIGLVPALVFLGQHRPRQWKRLAAWDASGFVMIAAAIYMRNIVLVISRWPGSPPNGWTDGLFGIFSLVVIDALFIIRVISYQKFARREQQNNSGQNTQTSA